MDSREKILDATARLYAELGYRGATTKRIAEEAGVNEVTLFRQFGSKSALIQEAVRHNAGRRPLPVLPEEPSEPVPELTNWCRAHMKYLKEARALFRKFMCDMQQYPALMATIRATPLFSEETLHRYVERLRRNGMASAEFDLVAAVQMLRGTLFADVMGRDLMPTRFPQPEREAPRLYALLFLRAIGVEVDPPGPAGSADRSDVPSSAPSGASTTTKRTR